ncbi:MAG: hypothetical protein DMG76_23950 [Acidobacteria bacterium]|nr:MAG: hypothetical protein DMG76_23950 [Acidobacteriota bacterium]
MLSAPWQLWTRQSPPGGLLKEDSKKGRSPLTLRGRVCYRALHDIHASCLIRMSKRQLVAVRIGHIEIAFSPGGISRDFRIKSPVLQMIPEGIHIRDVEDQPPPAGHRLTLFQIEDRRLGLFSKKRRETRVLSTIFFPILDAMRGVYLGSPYQI